MHLRSGLTGPAYEAVRKLDHGKLKTVDVNGKATMAGMELLIQTLKDNIAAEVPVKISELFFTAFYSPEVWRRPCSSTSSAASKTLQDPKNPQLEQQSVTICGV